MDINSKNDSFLSQKDIAQVKNEIEKHLSESTETLKKLAVTSETDNNSSELQQPLTNGNDVERTTSTGASSASS